MLHFTSNAAELARDTRPSRCLRLDAPSAAGRGGTVGGRMAAAIAVNIHERGMRGVGPETWWRLNAPSTIEDKGFNQPNVRTGAMLDERNIAGVVQSTARSMEMTYGTGAVDDRGTTDRMKATLAEDGQSAQLIKRPFFGINDRDCDALAEIAGDEWEARAGGRGGLPGAASAPALPGP